MKEKKLKWPDFYPAIFLLLGWLLIILGYYAVMSNTITPETATTLGARGDAVQGWSAPVIGGLGIVLTFAAFWVQFQANERQRKDIKRERFENKFYELLRLHKENVSEINIFRGTYTGRSAFIKMYEEYKDILYICRKIGVDNPQLIPLPKGIDPIVIYHEFAFKFFFFGVGQSTNEVHNTNDPFQAYINKVRTFLLLQQGSYDEVLATNKILKSSMIEAPFKPKEENFPLFKRHYIYRPFDGHISRLGHYYRHLFQMVKFVVVNNDLDLSKNEKYEYIKTLRATLSNHEQILLYYNAFNVPGKKWWKDNMTDLNGKEVTTHFILDYKLIKNIPLHLSEGGLKPHDKFKQELKRAYPNKSEKWYNEYIFSSFEELENLMTSF